MRWLMYLMLVSAYPLYAKENVEAFAKAYKSKSMEKACTIGRHLFRQNMRDENILIATGHACAEVDFIDFIGVLQQRMGESAQSRKAAVYFSTLLLQKRLISQFMHEDIDLSLYRLPMTDHILSEVYEALHNGHYQTIKADPKHLRIGDEMNYIDLFVDQKVYVNRYVAGKLIEEHRYR